MILAAGRGERLRPLTDRVPKPLLEAGGKPLLAWHLERLAAAGFSEAVINVAHLAERIEAAIGDGRGFGVRVAYSREAEPLETAGGIAHARELLGPDPFLLLNADVYCEIDLACLGRTALGDRVAHLVLAPNPLHRPAGDFSLESDLVGNAPAPRYTYTGIAVVSPELVAPVGPRDKVPLAPLLRAAAERGRIGGELYAGLWRDVGTAERLAELDAQLRARHGARR